MFFFYYPAPITHQPPLPPRSTRAPYGSSVDIKAASAGGGDPDVAAGPLLRQPLQSSRSSCLLGEGGEGEKRGRGGGGERLWNPSERCGLGWALHGERACPKMVIIGPSRCRWKTPPPPPHSRPSFFLAQAATLWVFAASWIMSRAACYRGLHVGGVQGSPAAPPSQPRTQTLSLMFHPAYRRMSSHSPLLGDKCSCWDLRQAITG